MGKKKRAKRTRNICSNILSAKCCLFLCRLLLSVVMSQYFIREPYGGALLVCGGEASSARLFTWLSLRSEIKNEIVGLYVTCKRFAWWIINKHTMLRRMIVHIASATVVVVDENWMRS